MDDSQSHGTTLGLFHPGEMIDLSCCEFTPGPFLIHDKHRQESNQETVSSVNPALSYSAEENHEIVKETYLVLLPLLYKRTKSLLVNYFRKLFFFILNI